MNATLKILRYTGKSRTNSAEAEMRTNAKRNDAIPVMGALKLKPSNYKCF